ncbi:hypothetical protein HNY73_005945 [Argiope bruennichi]|uniref:Uncharacterized protein n=1 Tax=Argiope bruennichi TaxID=94029 RepID=A0A8T0FLA9_ARGBR|nr:hypothetical protein HNY73_005945 [Argiope bruennichi]
MAGITSLNRKHGNIKSQLTKLNNALTEGRNKMHIPELQTQLGIVLNIERKFEELKDDSYKIAKEDTQKIETSLFEVDEDIQKFETPLQNLMVLQFMYKLCLTPMKFVRNCKFPEKEKVFLKQEEYMNAEKVLLKLVQVKDFSTEISALVKRTSAPSTKWLTITTKLLKMEESSEPNPGRSNETRIRARQKALFTPRHNFNDRFQNSYVPRVQNYFRQNYQNSIRPCPNNFNSYGHDLHFQQRLPSSPCRICTQKGIPYAYHWTQVCHFHQPQFMINVPITANLTSPCTEVPLGCSQNPGLRQNSPNVAPYPAQ